MKLPAPIQRYFEADASGDADRLLEAFAPDARVTDEGETHSGHREIAAWWRAAKARYRHRAHPLEADETGEGTRVRAEVTGDFPGSPAVLGFTFQVRDERIVRLVIGA